MWLPHYLRSPALDGGGAATDPNFASVVLLAVNDNKGNGTTSFADQSSIARTLTANGTIAYSTSSAPTGMTSSATCNGTAYLTSANSTDFDFGAGDFTVEAEVNFTTQPTAIFIAKDDVTNRSWHIAWVSGTGWQVGYFVGGVGTFYRPGTGSATTGTWYHIAASRVGTNLYFFQNGTQVAAPNSIGSQTIDTKTALQSVGATGAGSFGLNGFISNVRITKGVGRYSSNFTPPTLPMPTS